MGSTDTSTSAPAQRQRRLRKSIAHMPSPEGPPTIADKENITTDFSSFTTLNKPPAPTSKTSRKARSKSIGPGGLIDATGNRRKSAVPAGFKSILLPTIPLSPLQEIPSHASSRKAQKDDKPSGPAADLTERAESDGSLFPDISAVLQNDGLSKTPAPVSGLANLQNPFALTPVTNASEMKVTLKTEEEQQAAAREREEKERRELEKNEILQRRDARRKSLANRRVSFAPEATLHTWDVVEYIQDSTTSSASTNSTRRASEVSTTSGTTQSPALSSDPAEPPSTPEQVEYPDAPPLPTRQRQLHQKKRRRRSSTIPPMNFNNPEEEEFSSSPFSGSSAAGSDDTGSHTFLTANEDNSSASGTESADEGGSTIMSLDEGDITSHSSSSGRSTGGSSTGSTGRLEDALRLAAQQAGTQGIEYDENGDLSMEFANEEITTAFQPWVKKLSTSATKDLENLTSFQDQENQNLFSARKTRTPHTENQDSNPNEDGDMSMDITRAVGGILNTQSLGKAAPTAKRRKSVASTRRRSSVNRRRSSGDSSSMGDQTMDFTMAIGGIQGETRQAEAENTIDEDEDMTMELTSVIGRVLPSKSEVGKRRRSSAGRQLAQEARRRESGLSLEEDMDETMAIGQILPNTAEEETDRKNMMDLTTAIGGILPTGSRPKAKAATEQETDFGEITSSPFQAEVPPSSPPKPAIGLQVATVASATGSPSLFNTKAKAGARRSLGGRPSATPRTGKKRVSLSGTPTTPPKQRTPQLPKPTTPAKTPTPKSVTFRSASPKKLFSEELKITASTPRSSPSKTIFTQDGKTGLFTPSVILTPRPRQSSGLGIDKEGLGSPRVAALLDRRRSIGEDAKAFVPSLGEGIVSTVRFEDPRVMEIELDKERQEEEKRESERRLRHNDADEEKDATVNLKEMIKSLTPKKKVNGRKSLAVGAARGLLGKRPAELDEDDESDGSAKRVRVGKETSPVKSVKLRPPPSKVETTGRITRRSLVGVSPSTMPASGSPANSRTPSTTPKRQRGSEIADIQPSSVKRTSASGETVALKNDSQLEEEVEEKIHLQDFLNLTSIRFMELNTTKRRYTVAQSNTLEGSRNISRPLADGSEPNNDDAKRDLETCVVAGACTIPMLELYQHSCHELKKYISEGRRVVREIESDTYEENPPLFQEYMSAPPDVRYIMDNQFKNVKTHARLLSKATWYEWRMGLLCGLQEGLDKARQDMNADEETLRQQEDLLAPVVPVLVEKNKELESQYAQLQAQADELANCDQEELQAARDELTAVEAKIEATKTKLEEVQKTVSEKNEAIKTVKEGVEECKREIAEAERQREELRGWSSGEVGGLKANVDALEKKYGWTISAVSGSTLTMTYHRDIQLTFDVSSFLPNDGSRPAMKLENSPIELSYIADRRDYHAHQLTAPRTFVLLNLKALLGGLQQSATKVKDLLALISEAWNKANTIEEDIRLLNLHCPTEATISDGGGHHENLLVKSTLLLPSRATKVEVAFNATFGSEGGLDAVSVEPEARVVYGEQLDERKMSEFLAGKIAGNVLPRVRGGWGVAVRGLRERLAARGKKG